MAIVSINTKQEGLSAAKKLPYNIDAEQIVLGCVLNNNENVNRIGDFLTAENFYEPVHQKIYKAALNLIDKGIQANAVTLKNHFNNDEAFNEIGGAAYLVNISSIASGILGVKDYALIVYNLSISRNLINICEETLEDCYSSNGDRSAGEQIEKPEGKLFNLASTGFSETGFNSIKKSALDALKVSELASKNDGTVSGVATKFADIDNLLGGFNRSDLLILAARPSMGKTALALNFAVNAAEFLVERYKNELEKYNNNQGQYIEEPKLGSAGFISLEMSAEQLATRILSVKTGINASNIRRGILIKTPANDEYAKLIAAHNEVSELPIFIDDTPALTISALRTRARRLKRKHNLEILFVDYLQLLRGVNKKSEDSRVQEISEISMGLKAIAKELNIPVIALSQLSRQVEQRADHRPQLSDLRESGSIEQDADIVMFIYREAYYKERDKPSEDQLDKMQKWQEEMEKIDNVSEIIIAKNRNGPINNVRLFFDKNTTKFANLEQQGY